VAKELAVSQVRDCEELFVLDFEKYKREDKTINECASRKEQSRMRVGETLRSNND